MSTSFVDLVAPPGPAAYEALDKLMNHDTPAPTSSVAPATFLDALIVRKVVFIDEQRCRLENEVDADDPRAYHWVVHASVSTPTVNTADAASKDPYVRRKSGGGRVPVGTVRIVPSPHGPHPAPGSIDGEGGEEVKGHKEGGDRPTKFHDGREAYVKIGRLATIKEYRGLGLGRLLCNEALQWASRNKEKLQAMPDDPVERERIGGDGDGWEWKGLVMAHAQTTAIKFYQSMGFELDEELGTWVEEGIEHVAMWKRLELAKNVTSP